MAKSSGLGGVSENAMQFAIIAFLLLGVLFGMNIMAFIFGNLGPSQAGLTAGDEAFNTSIQIQNNSLNAIVTYSAQANTQMSTIAIAITLIILLAVFALFWKFFIGSSSMGGKGSAGPGNFQ